MLISVSLASNGSADVITSIFNSTVVNWTRYFLPCHNSPNGARPPHYRGFTSTLRHTTLGKTSLDEWWAWRRDLYLTTHNTHKRQVSMPPAEFEPAISASERTQTNACERAATGNGATYLVTLNKHCLSVWRHITLVHSNRHNYAM